ncbi:MAG TPA: hypothetical protein VMH83_15065 [Candidatus Acidoferrum sp.]|nr:hypothetical protein [Candidatus Acidoferrum sp.]
MDLLAWFLIITNALLFCAIAYYVTLGWLAYRKLKPTLDGIEQFIRAYKPILIGVTATPPAPQPRIDQVVH